MSPRAKQQEQLAFDEQVADDQELLNALEVHAGRKASRQELALEEKQAKERVDALIAKYDVTTEQPLRIGRFRIERITSAGRAVSFETAPSSRLRITPVEDERPNLRVAE